MNPKNCPITKEQLEYSAELLKNAHHLLQVECRHCRWYESDKDLEDLDNYRGTCQYDDEHIHKTYWSQYCDDFEGTLI